MSLKAFHLVFLAASIALSVGLGVWCFSYPHEQGRTGYFVLGAAAFAVGFALLVYGRRFLKRTRGLGIL